MRHHITAVFNNRIDAQHVLEQLLVLGCPYYGTALVSPPDIDTIHAPDSAPYRMLRRTIARLFESPQEQSPQVDHQIDFLPGRHVINTRAATDLDSVHAIELIERFSPVYIEDRRTTVEKFVQNVRP
jgi:hypothetical protein